MIKCYTRDEGIGLLQIIISLGLVGGLLLIVFQTSSIVGSIGIQAAESTDMEIFLSELRRNISSTDSCKKLLAQGIEIKDPVEGAVYSVLKVKRTDSLNLYLKGTTEKFGNITLDKIQYEIPSGGLEDLGSDKYSIKGNLRVIMKRRTGGRLDRIIPVDLNIDNSKTPLVDNVTSCSAGLSSELDTLIAACKLMNGTVTSTQPFNCDSDMGGDGGGVIWY